MLKAFRDWFCSHVLFVSWGRWWKGVYLHFLPLYTVRVFLWGVDWSPKNPFSGRKRGGWPKQEACDLPGDGESVPPNEAMAQLRSAHRRTQRAVSKYRAEQAAELAEAAEHMPEKDW